MKRIESTCTRWCCAPKISRKSQVVEYSESAGDDALGPALNIVSFPYKIRHGTDLLVRAANYQFIPVSGFLLSLQYLLEPLLTVHTAGA